MTLREKVAEEIDGFMDNARHDCTTNRAVACDRILALWDEEWMEVQVKLADALREVVLLTEERDVLKRATEKRIPLQYEWNRLTKERDHYERTVSRMAEEWDHLQSRESEADGIIRELRDSLKVMLPYAEDLCNNTDDDKGLIAQADAWLDGAAP